MRTIRLATTRTLGGPHSGPYALFSPPRLGEGTGEGFFANGSESHTPSAQRSQHMKRAGCILNSAPAPR
jgi:hypothetical protein